MKTRISAWKPVVPALVALLMLSSAGTTQSATTNSLVIRADKPGSTISKNIYGQFSEHLGRCIYEGIWVGESSPIPNTRGIRNDVVEALKKLKVPVLRWPGGCFADEYHWKDGVGPREKRPTIINTHWGGVVENNHFGTHEFFDLCEQVGCEPYVCGNVGSGTVQEMMEWVEYMTSDADSPMANMRRANGRHEPWSLKFFGVGNENWGCGGNMTAEYYSDNYRRYSTFVKNYGTNRIYKIAGGANAADYHWTGVLMTNAARHMNGLSVHYYTIPTGNWGKKGSATKFGEAEYHATLRHGLEMKDLIEKHSAIMDKVDPNKRVGMMVDEWGIWTDVEPGTNPGFLYQQNTLRDAILAGVTLNLFHKHCDRIKMANIAQAINVLQAMILTDKEKILLTPTYHVFEMYIPHQEGTLLPTELKAGDYTLDGRSVPGISVSASRNAEGTIHVSLCNLNAQEAATVSCRLEGATAKRISGRVLTAPEVNTHNTFDQPKAVEPAAFNDFQQADAGFTVTLPSKSVVVLQLR